MGLSNEERYNKIAWAIDHITNLVEKLDDKYTTTKLKGMVERLWYEFLKNDSNGVYWFIGGTLHDDRIHRESLIAPAFECHVPKKQDDWLAERREKDGYFDHYKWVKDNAISMEALLNHTSEPYRGAVLMTYLHTEAIAYALCRYHDDFMDRYESLNVLLRQMQGECFKFFKMDRTFTHAWMVHNLCDRVITMQEEDLVNKWWQKHCLHHEVKLEFDDYDAAFELFKKHQFRDLSIQDRIDITLALVSERYHEEFQHNEFLKMVKEYNKNKEVKVKLKVKQLEDHFKKVRDNHKEETNKPYERDCEFTSNYVDRDGEVKNIWS